MSTYRPERWTLKTKQKRQVSFWFTYHLFRGVIAANSVKCHCLLQKSDEPYYIVVVCTLVYIILNEIGLAVYSINSLHGLTQTHDRSLNETNTGDFMCTFSIQAGYQRSHVCVYLNRRNHYSCENPQYANYVEHVSCSRSLEKFQGILSDVYLYQIPPAVVRHVRIIIILLFQYSKIPWMFMLA